MAVAAYMLLVVVSLLVCGEGLATTSINRGEGQFTFGNFIRSIDGHAINKHGTLISNTTTANGDDCWRKCIQHALCLSINLLRSHQPKVFHCELLHWAGTDFSRYLEPRANSYSMQLVTACLSKPCKNGGECIATGPGAHQYVCNCTAQRGGRHCETAKCGVLFDFEDGSLTGWSLTGTVFNNQPTYGDNSGARPPYHPSNQRGDWWIGGAEDRPSPSRPLGKTQWDSPTGTMTSPPFTINGKTLKFLIGGGSDINTERVELLIKDAVVARATGANHESMATKSFDVSSYRGQVAQIRIVDGSSVAWGHINVDHFEESICTE